VPDDDRAKSEEPMTDQPNRPPESNGPGAAPTATEHTSTGDAAADRPPTGNAAPGRPPTGVAAAGDPPTQAAAAVEQRLVDHAAIDRLAGELLPALAEKLAATGLGEIEVREGSWKVRLRRPADAPGPNFGRRATDGPSRAQPGHAGHGHAPAALEGHRSAREGRAHGVGAGAGAGSGSGSGSGNGSYQALTAVGTGHVESAPGRATFTVPGTGAPHRAVATSPAVGVYQPRRDLKAGARVRAGDRLGFVDLLGVPQEVVAPVDGLVGASLVEPGEAVEYGQELIVIELAGAASGVGDASFGGSSGPGGSGGASGSGGVGGPAGMEP
jgi:biotin carboxyl carrier protein